MSARQRRTIDKIFEKPSRADIEWQRDVKPLLVALGATFKEKGGRVFVLLNGVRWRTHPPHPKKEMDKGAVKDLRDFLMRAEIEENYDL